jgi:hypothetical protein
MKLMPVVLMMLVFTLFAGCKQKNSDNNSNLDTDIVKNPISGTGQSSNEELPEFSFTNDNYDFGQIIAGEKVMYSFRFTNSGKSDLIISSASGSCGCTVPEWPKQPIPPGGKSTIDVIYNSAGKSGKQRVTISIISNTIPNTKVLTLTGEVTASNNPS